MGGRGGRRPSGLEIVLTLGFENVEERRLRTEDWASAGFVDA